MCEMETLHLASGTHSEKYNELAREGFAATQEVERDAKHAVAMCVFRDCARL